MDFKVGDQVIHCSYGPGEIVELDEKIISGRKGTYYIVQLNNLKLWVPMGENGASSLRFVTTKRRFKRCLQTLVSSGEELPEDRLARKNLLVERLKDGRLDSVCRVVRDLTHLSRQKKLSEYDHAIFERAKGFLLAEWEIAFSVSPQQAEQELQELLKKPV